LLLVDPSNDAEMEAAEKLNARIVRLALSMDGTCTGEHGIGLHKIPYLAEEAGEEAVNLMRLIKRGMDPLNLLNPGKIFSFTQ
jgi:D-lactate dehydrogenase (cytochrome)